MSNLITPHAMIPTPMPTLHHRFTTGSHHLTVIVTRSRHRCDRILTWNSGALHYSDEVILVRGLTELATNRAALQNDINGIDYIGKGTYTDCAIKRGLAELLIA